MAKIVIVEDELIVARDISRTLEKNNYEVAGIARTFDDALKLIETSKPWIVLLDIFLKGDRTGIDLAARLNSMGIPFIYISANSNQHVLEAVKPTNPFGFIVKPFRDRDLLVTLEIARYRHDINSQLDHSDTKRAVERSLYEGVMGTNSVMLKVFDLANKVASSDTSVLLQGDSGTGKELIANYIVQQSPRKTKPFIKVNCAAIPASLMESEFFGHEKGAFTGAGGRKSGKFEMAFGGTMLLDEIGDMPLDLQSKLLRVLQEKEIQRLGGNDTIKIDARIIAATSKNLEKEVAEGRFRLDLYYRLHVFPITLPPLRERKEDIPALTRHFIKQLVQKTGTSINDISGKALSELLNYDWPGNIRELEHVVERSFLMTKGSVIEHIQLPSKENKEQTSSSEIKSLEEHEREHILEVLKRTNGRIDGPSGAAAILKIPASTLHAKIKKLGIKRMYE
jgi:DNA-binding NtrC family response regulator